MGLKEGIYQLFFKRSTIYVPFVLVGAYFANEAVDTVINSVWEGRNKGKLFKDMEIPAPAAE
ncbi:MAG: putative ubiquinone-cytochrome c reductase [Monoraphidium minutum]|nr:MAG: putative ubiquinone-cytochrome c reductase [Monoraphidium minutum]